MKSCCAHFTLSLLIPASGIRSAVTASRVFPKQSIARRKATMASASKKYASIQKEQPGDETDDVLFNSLYGVRTVELNRPKKLNSLNGSMARKIMPRLREWEKSQMANIILITGSGNKAFCAGGDVAALAQQNGSKEGQKSSTDYFALEYQLDQLIATYSKPYIAVIDGITMGGGVGLSVHAPFRIATERTVFAMPETTIGFFPDVGGGFFLPRLDGEIGTYLALTSEQLHGVQAFYAGIASHYVDSSLLASLTTRLSELVFRDNAPLKERLDLINSTIAEFTSDLPSPDSYQKAVNGNLTGELRMAIDRTFKFDSIDEILEALRQETHSESKRISEWANATLNTIAQRSPTSVKVTLQQLRLGRNWDISETFIREHQMAARFMAHPDFNEGVEAKLVRRSKEKPQWQPDEFAQITQDNIDEFFTLPEGVEELKFLEPMPGAQPQVYKSYPHAAYSLPSEQQILQMIRNASGTTDKAIIKEVVSQWKQKLGVAEKVQDVLARQKMAKGESQSPSRANL